MSAVVNKALEDFTLKAIHCSVIYNINKRAVEPTDTFTQTHHRNHAWNVRFLSQNYCLALKVETERLLRNVG